MPTWSQSDVDELKAAIRTGVQTVHYSGPPARTVTYQSLAEMRSLLAEMVAQVGNAAGTRKSRRLAAYRKGV
jgi:hypothetical protein